MPGMTHAITLVSVCEFPVAEPRPIEPPCHFTYLTIYLVASAIGFHLTFTLLGGRKVTCTGGDRGVAVGVGVGVGVAVGVGVLVASGSVVAVGVAVGVGVGVIVEGEGRVI